MPVKQRPDDLSALFALAIIATPDDDEEGGDEAEDGRDAPVFEGDLERGSMESC